MGINLINEQMNKLAYIPPFLGPVLFLLCLFFCFPGTWTFAFNLPCAILDKRRVYYSHRGFDIFATTITLLMAFHCKL